MKRVNAIGPKDADILIIGEAPGAEEEALGLPFVGTSGRLLDNCLSSANIDRNSCYITNVVKVRPPNNKMDRLKELGFSVEDFYAELREEILSVNPNIIIGLGNIPLKFLTGETSISKWRGSILKANVSGKEFKFLPTIHPAFCLRQWTMKHVLTFDLKKAKKESLDPAVVYMNREFITTPSFSQVHDALERFKKSEFLSIDLETHMRSGLIRCIGLTDTEDYGFCIPIIKSLKPYWNKEEEVYIWSHLYYILTDPKIKKIAQNAQFELTQLAPYTNSQMNIFIDTMRGHALIYPEFKHGLGFLTSIYTDMPYYKDDGKISDDKGRNFEQLQIYNCRDITVTYECAIKEIKELKEINMYRFYQEFDMPLLMTLWRMQQRGVKIDTSKLGGFKERMDNEIKELEVLLVNEIGHTVNVKSNKQMVKFLYEDLKLPKKFIRGKKNPTANEEALLELYKKNPHIKALDILVRIRRCRTLKETFLEMKLSSDGRIRTNYGITETGRLSSKKDLFGVGANLQNIPKRKGKWIREIFIPDEGKVMIKADLSQAEARVVAWLARDENYKNMFKTGKDIHQLYASLIFNKPYDSIIEAERDKAKDLRHAKNYNMGPNTLAKHLGVTTAEAKQLIREDDKLFPNIKGVFYANVQEQLRKDRTLTTPFGRKRTFFDRYSDALLREAYAHIPQSTVADYINRGLIELDYALPDGADLLIQVHDEILLQCFPSQVLEVSVLLKKHIEREILVGGEGLVIPLDIEVGPNWANVVKLEEWKETQCL